MLSRLAEVALTAVKALDLEGNDILADMVVTLRIEINRLATLLGLTRLEVCVQPYTALSYKLYGSRMTERCGASGAG